MADFAAGNMYAKNWQAEAQRILEDTVRVFFPTGRSTMTDSKQMATYWETHPTLSTATSTASIPSVSRSVSSLTGFDRHCQQLLASGEEGWVTELGHYLGDMPQDATPDMDVVKYWQVCSLTLQLPRDSTLTPHISRIITQSTQRLDELPSTSSPVKCLPLLRSRLT
jgi:hypothetical protein